MIDFTGLHEIVGSTSSKILMLVADGLGGLPHPETRRSELETANIPNLDRLAQHSACGLTTPVLPGIAPGSGPGHLALFGYDPVKYLIGRGILEALGIGVDVQKGEVAVRGNFCTVDGQNAITDRRAGRITSEEAIPLCKALDQIKVPGIEISVYPVQDYRFALVLRGPGVSDQISETDPGRLGLPPLPCREFSAVGAGTAAAVNTFISEARKVLQESFPANMLVLRGFSVLPNLPDMGVNYCLKPAAIAAYPMYRGLASLVGMEVLPSGPTFEDELDTLKNNFDRHDFFYLHYKPADAAGEDGDFDAKVRALETLDTYIPELMKLKPDVFMIAGDHATPAVIANHTWHPVPFLINSRWTEGEGVDEFHEKSCATGALGRLSAVHIMLLALAHADKLTKFGP